MDLIQKIADENSKVYNVLKLAEELSELSEVLLKLVNKPEGYKPPEIKIVEEMADVIIRMKVMATNFNIKDRVNDRVLVKLKYISDAIDKRGTVVSQNDPTDGGIQPN